MEINYQMAMASLRHPSIEKSIVRLADGAGYLLTCHQLANKDISALVERRSTAILATFEFPLEPGQDDKILIFTQAELRFVNSSRKVSKFELITLTAPVGMYSPHVIKNGAEPIVAGCIRNDSGWALSSACFWGHIFGHKRGGSVTVGWPPFLSMPLSNKSLAA